MMGESVEDVGRRAMEQLRALRSQQPGSVLVASLSTLLVTLIIVYVVQARQQRKRLPPGPRPWPLLGNLPHLGTQPHQALSSLAAKYGGLMFIRMGSRPCIVVSNTAVAKELFRTNDTVFASRPLRLAGKIYSGGKNVATTPYGPYWRELRKVFATELFSNRRHASHQKGRTEEIHYMMKLLLQSSKQDADVNLKTWLYGVASNNMTRMLVNKRYYGDGVTSNEQGRKDIEEMVTRIFLMFSQPVISDFVPWLSFVPKLQGTEAQFQDVRAFTYTVTDKLIDKQKHRSRAQERERQSEPDFVPDFIDVLMETKLENGQHIPDQDLNVLFMDIMSGGTETTSTSLEWAMAELMNHPEVMKQAQEEIDAVVGSDRVVEEADIANLPFLQAIVKEVFRLHPAIPLSLPRVSTQATELLGYQLPNETELILNIFAIHRDPAVYEAPESFDPARFMGKHADVTPTSGFDHYELIPFSAGRRMCPAYNLGTVMINLVLAHLLHSFDWSLPAGESLDMAETFGMSMQKTIPLRLVSHPKAPAFLY